MKDDPLIHYFIVRFVWMYGNYASNEQINQLIFDAIKMVDC